MADLPNLDAARAALEARRRGKWDDIALADALAAVDALTARLVEVEEHGGTWTAKAGAEAEELRRAMERYTDGPIAAEMQAILDEVDARDSLAALDALDKMTKERDEARARLAEAEAENRRLRDVLGWTNQQCPGKCGAAAFDALAAKVTP